MRKAVYWLTPPLFCLFIYWFGLLAWFQQDDFAWLSLPRITHSWADFWDNMFAPKAQGTIRPWSERLFFYTFFQLFGLHSLPYRIWVFLNQFLDLILLALVVTRLTGLRWAGFFACLLWTANWTLSIPMVWTSAYNEIQLSGFLLLSFYLFLRYTETGDRRYYRWQWVTFLLGFGSLELNVVYPALAVVYALCCARKALKAALALVPVSVVYYGIHWLSRRGQPPNWYYEQHFDSGILSTFWMYWNWSLGVAKYAELRQKPEWFATGATLLLTVALLGFAIDRLRRGQRLPLFFLAWYLLILIPLLPLKNHITDYYLTIPTIGLAMLGGWGVALAMRQSWTWGTLAALLALFYAIPSAKVARTVTRYWYDQAEKVETIVESVAYARRLYPQKTILLKGINDELFWSAIYSEPFHVLGMSNIYLTPETEAQISPNPKLADISTYFLPARTTQQLLFRDQVAVYEVGEHRLRNVTSLYSRVVAPRLAKGAPRRIDVGQPLFADQLGLGWYAAEDGYRWMGKRAEVRLGGPQTAQEKLYLKGFCPAQLVTNSPAYLTVMIGGHTLPPATLDRDHLSFEFSWPIPEDQIGRPEIDIVVAVDRTFRSGRDVRDLGLAFGHLSVR